MVIKEVWKLKFVVEDRKDCCFVEKIVVRCVASPGRMGMQRSRVKNADSDYISFHVRRLVTGALFSTQRRTRRPR